MAKIKEYTKTKKIMKPIKEQYKEIVCGFNDERTENEHAIEFAEWCDDNYFKNGKGNSNWSASMDWDDNEKFTTKELLEIFKKEKGL
jgi:hypothetical protein